MKIRRFTVRGCGTFPLDMLGNDKCWPARPGSNDALSQDHYAPTRSIEMESYDMNVPSNRWHSRGWDVLNVR